MSRKRMILLLLSMAVITAGIILVPKNIHKSPLYPVAGAEEPKQEETVTISRAEYEKLKMFSELSELMDGIEAYYYKDSDRNTLLEYAAKGLMQGLNDPYSFYFNPEEFEELWKEDEGRYTGIGILISSNYTTQICTISRVFRNSPAEKAGLRRGDILYRIGEELYVQANNITQAVNMMRGIPGENVEVTVLRNNEEITFHILREEIFVNRIEEKMLNDQIGYIAYYEFEGKADQEFEKALNRLMSQNAKGIIIDLRDNGGGWVKQACQVSDLFMDQGETCYLVYKGGNEIHNEYPTSDGKADVPLVILLNENSASASEILAGALRDCADATIVGTKSYGKGIVQGVWSVGTNGAGLQMTVAEYFTPKGNKVHEIGIAPDVEVPLPEGDSGMYQFADTEHDVQLKKALEVISEKLK